MYESSHKLPISAFIITRNEEENIVRCLESLSFCAEIIIVDSGSADLTCELAEKAGATVIRHDFEGFGKQKNFALNQCCHDWVISLDADEEVTPELEDYIRKLDLQNSAYCGFEIKRRHFFLGRKISHSGLYPDHKLRLFRRSKGHFKDVEIHELVEVEGPTKKLSLDLNHYSWSGVKDFFARQFKYAEKVAQLKYQEGLRIGAWEIAVRPAFNFLYRYFFRLGILDGSAGFILCLGWAAATSYKYFLLWEMQLKDANPFPNDPVLRLLLKPAQIIYELIVNVRLALYESGIFKSHQTGLKVVSVGNLTAGGAGKTPFTIWLANELWQAKPTARLAILTRGYHAKERSSEPVLVEPQMTTAQVGDEPLLMCREFQRGGKKVSVIVSPNRVKGADFARQKLATEVVILDDGYQHLPLKRDINICLIDCSDAHSKELLPLGSLREPLTQLKRADIFVLTRARFNPILKTLYLSLLERYAPHAEIYDLKEEIGHFSLIGRPEQSLDLVGKKVIAFCGLGNPYQFFESLKQKGVQVTKAVAFPDHYTYTTRDLSNLTKLKEAADVQYLVTTTKDAVKIEEIGELAGLTLAHLTILSLDLIKTGQSRNSWANLRTNLLG
ncbi:MAG: tetraacyldisaccharide 4'-kinase [Candidatus Caenarcaniphilales bacterium]|nr:tetraacyldisaccharide 4'-kinase [Candidatus Caenarcaniphilales bacterium]